MSDEVKCPNCGESLDHVMQSHYDYRDNRYSCSAPTSDPEAAAEALAQAGVFKGAEGLHRLAESDAFWEGKQYGKRLYFGDGGADYLHRDVIRAAVRSLAELTRLRAEVQALKEDKAMLDWTEKRIAKAPYFDGKFYTEDNAGFPTLRDAIRAAMERSAE